MSALDLKTTRPELPAFDAVVRQARDLPVMTRHHWLKDPLPRTFRWLLLNPDAARALAVEAERLKAHYPAPLVGSETERIEQERQAA